MPTSFFLVRAVVAAPLCDKCDHWTSTDLLPRMAVRGRPFLSEHADDNRFRYYKGGLTQRNPPLTAVTAPYAARLRPTR